MYNEPSMEVRKLMAEATIHSEQAQAGAIPWFARRAPAIAAKWQAFHDTVYEKGRLDRKTKELIAAAAATFNRCAHCTRSHIQKAQEHGATKEEVAEALMMAGLLASGTQLHWMLEDYQELLADGEPTTPWFLARAGEIGRAWKAFYDVVYAESALDRKTKELLAVALAALGRCRHCTTKHIELAQQFGASKEELAEAILVAALVASGTQLFWMIEDYEQLLG